MRIDYSVINAGNVYSERKRKILALSDLKDGLVSLIKITRIQKEIMHVFIICIDKTEKIVLSGYKNDVTFNGLLSERPIFKLLCCS